MKLLQLTDSATYLPEKTAFCCPGITNWTFNWSVILIPGSFLVSKMQLQICKNNIFIELVFWKFGLTQGIFNLLTTSHLIKFKINTFFISHKWKCEVYGKFGDVGNLR